MQSNIQQCYPSLYTFYESHFFPGQTPVPPRSGTCIPDLSHDPIWAIWLAEVRKFHQHHDRISIPQCAIFVIEICTQIYHCHYSMVLEAAPIPNIKHVIVKIPWRRRALRMMISMMTSWHADVFHTNRSLLRESTRGVCVCVCVWWGWGVMFYLPLSRTSGWKKNWIACDLGKSWAPTISPLSNNK